MCNNNEKLDKRILRAEKLVEHLMAEQENYHSHKETMAHAGLLVMLTFFGSILLRKKWPPDWVPKVSIVLSARNTAFIGLLVIWLLLHFYIRWQLRNRRAAAITLAGATQALAEFVWREPKEDDFARYSENSEKKSKYFAKNTVLCILDFIFPFPRATVASDIENTNLPIWLVNALKEKEKRNTGAICGEWLVTLGSFIILILTIVRVLR